MKRYFSYLWYVLRHKWFVFLACFETKAPLYLAIIHDLSKFTPTEFIPYSYNFYNADGSKRTVRDKTGAYDPNSQSDDFKRAWLSHQRNKHHWQAWVSVGNYGNLMALPMPEKYVREMVADWKGAGRAIKGTDEAKEWYLANASKM